MSRRPAPSSKLQPLREILDPIAESCNLDTSESDRPAKTTISKLRRSRRRPFSDSVGVLTLLRVDDTFVWSHGAGYNRGPARRLRAGGASGNAEVVTQYRFEKLGLNEVGKALSNLDQKLNPRSGIVQLNGKLEWASTDKVTAAGRVLVLVHGTFSSCNHLLEEFKSTREGIDLLRSWLRTYKAVLGFDHPTVSVSPILNAIDLSRAMAGVTGDIHVVAHSRGGLVTRWWLDVLDAGRTNARHAVLVGSPLQGTSLASPARLRASLSLLTNIGEALRLAGASATAFMPFLTAPMVLLKVLTSVTGALAKVPILDAGIAMIPGLAAQSKVLNNTEIERLANARATSPVNYCVVRSNFESENPGWKFWRYFRPQVAADVVADVVFDGHNDLVVDTESMDAWTTLPTADRVLDFFTSANVHHCNYFRQRETIEFLRQVQR